MLRWGFSFAYKHIGCSGALAYQRLSWESEVGSSLLCHSEDHESHCHYRYVLLPFFPVFWGKVSHINTNHGHKGLWSCTSRGFGQGKTLPWFSPYQVPVKDHRHQRQGEYSKVYISGNAETLVSLNYSLWPSNWYEITFSFPHH